VTAHATAGWRHAFGDVTPALSLAFASGSSPFTIAGVPIAKDSAVIEAGLDFDIRANVRLGLSYSGQLASRAQD
ncbi:autotransporter outer membrane beta-barrel domain-containing protein, partial [Klebsiella oxytoca]|uniref:autotransporter outer membrane beta-barrel domain-containing protein n=1 Tax=Klebsiella oxytoca TaxID=571 RepID=UPI0013D8AB6E